MNDIIDYFYQTSNLERKEIEMLKNCLVVSSFSYVDKKSGKNKGCVKALPIRYTQDNCLYFGKEIFQVVQTNDIKEYKVGSIYEYETSLNEYDRIVTTIGKLVKEVKFS